MDADTNNTYKVTVKANDGTHMAIKNVTVMVTDVEELGTLSGDSSPSYMENSDDAVGTYTADDPDTATWSLEGDDAGDFMLASDGVLKFKSSPNYEMPRDADTDNIYMVIVKAEAGGEMDMVDVTITVTDVDERGTVTLSSMQPVVDAALTARVEDPDGVVSVEPWQWARSDTSGGTYTTISGAMSASYTPVETDEGYYLKVTANYTDGFGSGKNASAITAITAGPVTLAISGPSDPNYMENGTDAVDTYTASGPGATSAIWTLEGDDADDFVVEGPGESVMLKFSSPPDYENAEDSGTDNTYKVTLKATAGTNMDTHDVTVMVTNVEELGRWPGIPAPATKRAARAPWRPTRPRSDRCRTWIGR